MRKPLTIVFPYIVAALLVGGFVAWHVGPSSAAQASPSSAAHVTPPTPDAGSVYAIPITRPGKTPEYTLEDVRAFVTAHPGGAMATVSGAPFRIDDVQFVTRELAEQMMRGESLQGQVAPGDLVCIVALSGPFTGQGISGMPGARVRKWQPAHAVLVFDAHTGKLLVQGYHD